jgi:hypothetical protein
MHFVSREESHAGGGSWEVQPVLITIIDEEIVARGAGKATGKPLKYWKQFEMF